MVNAHYALMEAESVGNQTNQIRPSETVAASFVTGARAERSPRPND
jgi:hypothetical protein